MLKTHSVLIFFILSFISSKVFAETVDSIVAKKSDWTVFVAYEPKQCWAVSAPLESVNKKDGVVVEVNRGLTQLFALFEPSKKIKDEISFTGGYPFAEETTNESGAIAFTVSMKIDGVNFNLRTEGGEWAWSPNPDVDKTIISAMKRGSKAVLTGQSSRGTVTKDTFSLLGFTAALKEANERCSN